MCVGCYSIQRMTRDKPIESIWLAAKREGKIEQNSGWANRIFSCTSRSTDRDISFASTRHVTGIFIAPSSVGTRLDDAKYNGIFSTSTLLEEEKKIENNSWETNLDRCEFTSVPLPVLLISGKPCSIPHKKDIKGKKTLRVRLSISKQKSRWSIHPGAGKSTNLQDCSDDLKDRAFRSTTYRNKST